MNFLSFGLSRPLLRAISEQGYEVSTPIQAQVIPVALKKKDIMAAAQTGTGKTAAFALPTLELLSQGKRAETNQVRALILAPTRELAAQIGESMVTYGKYLTLRSAVVFGGVKVNPQIKKLREGVDILVATPGRLLDIYQQNGVKFMSLKILVLDEADRMLDMGFIHDIQKILRILPRNRQNLMFSATFSGEMRNLAKSLINNPIEISVTPRNTTAETITQWVYPVDKKNKTALLTHLIHDNQWEQVLVFSKTKHGANRLVRCLQDNRIIAEAIHGNKSQGARTRALFKFKIGKIKILVATDIAARGLDINELPYVINFDLPYLAEDYVHRIGRTGRAGMKGQAISLVSADEFKLLLNIERLTKMVLKRKIILGFEPKNRLPKSNLVKYSPKSK